MAITLKSARVNKDLTQAQAAKLIGITVDTLSNYERGKSYPDVPVIQKIEEVYEVSYSDLIFCPKQRLNRKYIEN
ncbi:MAG: helix-turn-helix transcriptional regulator [Lachnospiraceae bacterium]|nr:helix-turn-helix transcriptional regulator [Lachnospiraceae bacterium]